MPEYTTAAAGSTKKTAIKSMKVTIIIINVKIKSIIGPDAVFEGSLHAKETTRVDGLIRGDVTIDEVLILGVTGKVIGNVNAATIMVGGQVEGDLYAKEKIIISATRPPRSETISSSISSFAGIKSPMTLAFESSKDAALVL